MATRRLVATGRIDWQRQALREGDAFEIDNEHIADVLIKAGRAKPDPAVEEEREARKAARKPRTTQAYGTRDMTAATGGEAPPEPAASKAPPASAPVAAMTSGAKNGMTPEE